MSAPHITLTGADEKTSLAALERLVARRPGVEIGLLFSLSNPGNRYPHTDWLRYVVGHLGERCAVHVCGRAARAALFDGAAEWARWAGRVQVNGGVDEGTLHWLTSCYRVVITQYRGLALPPLDHLGKGEHQVLVDASGGRGVSPAEWTRPETTRAVGFAGGLGPDNLANELPRIAAVAREPWWVDMETKLRTNDWFDVALAERCVDRFAEFVAAVESAAPSAGAREESRP